MVPLTERAAAETTTRPLYAASAPQILLTFLGSLTDGRAKIFCSPSKKRSSASSGSSPGRAESLLKPLHRRDKLLPTGLLSKDAPSLLHDHPGDIDLPSRPVHEVVVGCERGEYRVELLHLREVFSRHHRLSLHYRIENLSLQLAYAVE